MRQELLIEFFSEEIPARLQKKTLRDSLNTFQNILKSYNATFSNVETYISPRRLTIRVLDLFPKTKDIFEEKRGPRIDAPEKALLGFLNGNKKEEKDLIQKDAYYFLNINTPGVLIENIIANIIEDFIAQMPWPKSMRWYLEDQKTLSASWIRPIRSIMCLYDEKPICVFIESVGLSTCDHTFGHRFLSSDSIRICDFDDYVHKLEKNYVMIDYAKKREFIDRELTQQAAAMGLCVKIDEELLDEVAGLVEYPFIHLGSIDEKFMVLPQEVLSTSMKVHQKYFTITYPDSVIAPFFGTVTNVPGTKTMYDGLDRVLRARLSDAMFFYKEDTDATLEAFTQRLSHVVFHEKLGSIAQKVDRMMSIANSKEEHRTIALCKADLLTQMVGEFPELQGIMGEIYARVQDEEKGVCVAIREHYKPLGAHDSLPETYIGARVSFFDKLDTLVGFLGVGIFPTGSKDPFALRRAALSVIRILVDFKEDILESETLDWYIKTLMNAYSDQGIALDSETLEDVKQFILDRLKVYMIEKEDIDQTAVDSVISACDKAETIDCRSIIQKALRLSKFEATEGFETIKNACKRASGILEDKEFSKVDDLTFADEGMKNLAKSLDELDGALDDSALFAKALNASENVLLVCDKILINDPNEAIRNKNFSILSKFLNLTKIKLGNV